MEVSPHEVAVLPGGDATGGLHPDAAGVADDLAGHVLGCLVSVAAREAVGLTADGPLGDVVGPLEGGYRSGRITEPGISHTCLRIQSKL